MIQRLVTALLTVIVLAGCAVLPTATVGTPWPTPTVISIQEGHTVSGALSGSWDCYNAGSSPVPISIRLTPLDRETYDQLEFVFEGVPDGEYTLQIVCNALSFGTPTAEIPVTVAGGDVHLDITLPFPALPTHAPTRTLTGHTDAVNGISFSPDGTLLASGAADGEVIMWDAASGERLWTLLGHVSPVQYAAFSPDGSLLASGSYDGGVVIWEAKSGVVLHTLQAHARAVNSLSFSPDGALLATGSDFEGVILWDAQTGEPLRELVGHKGTVHSLIFSHDGATLMGGIRGYDPAVVWWDTETGELLRSLPGTEFGMLGGITGLDVSPDGTWLALGLDGALEFAGGLVGWDVADGAKRFSVCHPKSLFSVTFSPDGSLIAATARDDTVILWSAADGQPLHVLKSETGSLYQTAWSPDGLWVAAGSADGLILFWEVPD